MNKKICQSCGLGMDTKDYGTNANGSKNQEYCHYCYEKGQFTDEGISMEQKMKKIIGIAIEEGIPKEEAKDMAEEILPTLKRWRK